MDNEMITVLIQNFKWILIGLGLMVVMVVFSFLQSVTPLIARRLFGNGEKKYAADQGADLTETLVELRMLMVRFTEAMENHNKFLQQFLVDRQKMVLQIDEIHNDVIRKAIRGGG